MITKTICIETPCHLKCSNQQIIVSYSHIKGNETKPDKSIPIEDVGILILEHPQITISHYLLQQFCENNVALVTCNASHHPSGILLPMAGNNLYSERSKAQIAAAEPIKKQVWQQIIKAKIHQQAQVLQQQGKPSGFLSSLIPQVRSADADNCEATAAAFYWKNLFPTAWQFFRKRDGLPPNNLLNYGYSIIRASMARAIVGAGLMPNLGVYHKNKYNAYCLADDLMEPYRPYVDLVVCNIVKNTSVIHELTKEFKVALLQVLSHDVFIQQQKSPLLLAMQRTASSLAKCYIEESSSHLLLPQITN